MYEEQIAALLAALPNAYAAFQLRYQFSGPALHFHQRSLSLRQSLLGGNDAELNSFTEMVYATLMSWGMDRLGSHTHMVPFEAFRHSLHALSGQIGAMLGLQPHEMTEADWTELHNIFLSLEIMATRCNLIAISKVLSNCLPNLLAPIDRAHTLRLLGGAYPPALPAETFRVREYAKFKEISTEFYHQLIADDVFLAFAEHIEIAEAGQGWNTSRLKLADNIVVGYRHI